MWVESDNKKMEDLLPALYRLWVNKWVNNWCFTRLVLCVCATYPWCVTMCVVTRCCDKLFLRTYNSEGKCCGVCVVADIQEDKSWRCAYFIVWVVLCCLSVVWILFCVGHILCWLRKTTSCKSWHLTVNTNNLQVCHEKTCAHLLRYDCVVLLFVSCWSCVMLVYELCWKMCYWVLAAGALGKHVWYSWGNSVCDLCPVFVVFHATFLRCISPHDQRHVKACEWVLTSGRQCTPICESRGAVSA